MLQKQLLTKETGWDFNNLYTGDGVVILKNVLSVNDVTHIVADIARQQFVLKEHQEINNGQEHCQYSHLLLIDMYQKVVAALPLNALATSLDCSCTKYPVSLSGSAFHKDFSWNTGFVLTFFFGETVFCVADTREGGNTRVYTVKAGDAVVMRAPRNYSATEIALRPIHAIGVVPNILYTFEIRQVDQLRKKLLEK
ncbi:MAG: hypothetical protein ABIO57_01075 [Candidatus Paceibacterota bacterium]